MTRAAARNECRGRSRAGEEGWAVKTSGASAPRPSRTKDDSSMDSQSVVIRFAGDSGDGVQLIGTQFVAATALAGDDFATFPDYPAEIRAPAGTTFGVSAYQIHLGARPITTAGDAPQVLVAFNPAALKVNLPLIADGALIVLNIDSFTSRGLAKAGYEKDPRQSGVLDGYQLIEVDITKHTLEATAKFGLSKSDAGRCKNFWALGLVQWMFNRDVASIEEWLNKKFAKDATIRDANLAALRAGHAYGETAELTAAVPHVGTQHAQFPPGEYRGVRGGEALALGLAAAGELADKPIIFCGYPITPASALLHQLARYGNMGVGTFQAEDEIAAVCAAIGASYGGAIGVTSSSGPGMNTAVATATQPIATATQQVEATETPAATNTLVPTATTASVQGVQATAPPAPTSTQVSQVQGVQATPPPAVRALPATGSGGGDQDNSMTLLIGLGMILAGTSVSLVALKRRAQ